MACWLAMVCVHPAGRSSIDVAWDLCPTRGAGEFPRTSAFLSGELSDKLCYHLFGGWTVGRGARLARLCAATYAILLWPIAGELAARRPVDILALARLP